MGEVLAERRGLSREKVARSIVALVRELVRETRGPAARRLVVEPSSKLQDDLGLDSLARVELFMRVEREFEASLRQDLIERTETVEELVEAVLEAGPRRAPADTKGAAAADLETLGEQPDSEATLIEVVQWHLDRHPERPHIFIYDDQERVEPLTYGGLEAGARKVAAGLQELGLQPGDRVALMLATGADYFYAFYGALLAGGIPVPLYPPARPSQLEDHLRRQAGILDNAGTRFLISMQEAQTLGKLLRGWVGELEQVVTVEQVSAGDREPAVRRPGPDDLAFLQYTSGSTGQPKGVMLTHRDLLVNLRALAEAAGVRRDDILVSWLPLYHDMGLIGAWMGSLYFALPLVLMSPLAFLSRPSRWLWAIHNHRGTASPAPNFAYELCVNKIEDEEIEGLDLSCWRLAVNGAEPVSATTLERFTQRFRPYGFEGGAMCPVYGLAEAGLGVAFPEPGKEPRIDGIGRAPMVGEGRAEPASEGDADVLRFVCCGRALPGYELRVVDEEGRLVEDRRQGHLQFKGPSSTQGYYRNDEATQALFDGDWVRTGDLAYLDAGELYLTGRSKDLIIRAGRNIYPEELEQAVGDLEGVRKGCVAVFATNDPRSATERLVVVAEVRPRQRDPEELRREIVRVTGDVVGTPPDEVVLARPQSVPKTSSGKLRRSETRKLFEEGRLRHGARGVWRQMLRLAAASFAGRARRLVRRGGEILYGLYFWLLIVLAAGPIWLGVVALPRRSWRQRFGGAGARLIALLSGTRLEVHGLEHLPRDFPCVVAANHASYLDGFVLAMKLPGELFFVAKKEFAGNAIAGPFLKRFGALLVERFDHRQAVRDARRTAALARGGRRVVVFPEGTFREMKGLLPFRMGAFVTSARTGLPIVPVAIRGTREKLRALRWLPRPGGIEIVIGEPQTPSGRDWAAAVELRERVRTWMLEQTGEPDLAD